MKKFLYLLVSMLTPALMAQTGAITGFCNNGASQAAVSGLQSTNFQQGIIPSCTVTVYLTGTTTLATIYADKNNTPLSNPFTSSSAGQWLFFAGASAGYDVALSGGVPPNSYAMPQTITGLFPSQQIMVNVGAAGLPFQVQYNSNGALAGSLATLDAAGNLNTPGTVSAAAMNVTTPASTGNVALKYNSSFAVQYEGPSSQGCSNLNDGLSPGTCVADRWTAWQNVLKANPAFGGAIHRLGGIGGACGGPSNKMWIIGPFDSAYVTMTATASSGVLTVASFLRGDGHVLAGYQLFDSGMNPVGSISAQTSGTYGSTGTYTWTNSGTFTSQTFTAVPVDDLLYQRVKVVNETDGHYINDKGHGTALACSAGNYAAKGSVTSGIFVAGESVTQATTGATGIVSAALAASGPLAINTYTGTSDSTHTWTGATSAAVFTPTGTMVQEVPMLISGTNNYPIEFEYQGQESALSALSLGYDSLTGANTKTTGITLDGGYYRSSPASSAGGIPIVISGSVNDTVIKNLGVQGNTSVSKATDGRDSSQAIVVAAGAQVTFQNDRIEYGSLKYNDGSCPINANQAGRIIVENSIFGLSIDDRGAVFAPRQFCGVISVKNSVVQIPVNGTDVPVLEVGTGDNVVAGVFTNPQDVELVNPQPWSNTGAFVSFVGSSLPGVMTGWPEGSGADFGIGPAYGPGARSGIYSHLPLKFTLQDGNTVMQTFGGLQLCPSSQGGIVTPDSSCPLFLRSDNFIPTFEFSPFFTNFASKLGSVTAISGTGLTGTGTVNLTHLNNNCNGCAATVTITAGAFTSASVTNAGSNATAAPTSATCTGATGSAVCPVTLTGDPGTVTITTTLTGPPACTGHCFQTILDATTNVQGAPITSGGGANQVWAAYADSQWRVVLAMNGPTSFSSTSMNLQFLDTASATPAAASVNYFGIGGLSRTTIANAMPWAALRACVITAVHYNQNVTGTLDTGANNFTFKVYDVTTSTAFADTAVTMTAQAVQQDGSLTTANDSVASGDKLLIQVTAPGSFTTPPTTILWSANVLCQ